MAIDVRNYALYIAASNDPSQGMGFYWDVDTQAFMFQADNGASIGESAQAIFDALEPLVNDAGFLASIRGE